MSYGDDKDSGAGGLGLGALGLFALAALVFLVMGFVFSMLAGLFAAPLLMLAARVPPGGARIGFGPAYGAAAAGCFAFLAVTVALLFVLPEHRSAPVLAAIDHALPHLLPDRMRALAAGAPRGPWSASLLMVTVPALAAFALALRTLGPPFDDALGFLRGLLAGVPALAVGLFGAGGIVALGAERVQSRQLALSSALSATFYLAVLGFLFALVAALVAGAVLAGVTRWLWRHPQAGYRRAYGVALRGLLAYLAVTGVVVFLLPDGNALPLYAVALARSGSPLAWAQAVQQHPIAGALQSLLLAQLPGLAVLAAVVAGGLSDAYAGLAGYLRALVSSAASLAAVAVGTLAVGLFTLGA
jgi:hypothetical protein